MKSTVKIPLIIAGILIGLGVIILVVGFALGGTSWLFGREATVEKTAEINDPFEHIKVETDSCDIRFAPAKDGKCRVEAQLTETMAFSAQVKNNTLTITCRDKRHWYQLINFRSFEAKMTVYLPEEEYLSLKLSTASGDVEIPGNLSFQSAELSSASGDFQFLANVTDSLSINTASGDMECSGMKDAAAIRMNTASGEIQLKNLTCREIKINSVSGDVRLQDVVCREEMSVDTTSGEVDFTDCDAEEITVQTVSGDVSGSLRSAKVFSTHTVSGDVRVPQDGNGGKCTVSTTSGDINLKISG